MSTESIRVDVVTAIEAAKVSFSEGYPLVIEYENVALVDTKTQANPFMTVEIRLMSGEQADLAKHPLHRIYGQIIIAAVVPENTGTSKANKLRDFFYPKLQRKSLGSLRTHMATLAPAHPHLGWVYYPVVIPFWTDQAS